MSTLLRERSYRLVIGNLAITGLDIAFTVNRSLKSTKHNTAEIVVRNLSNDQRAQIDSQDVSVILEVGYKGENSLIYSGDLREVKSDREGPDIVTTLNTGDGERKKRTGRVSKGFAPKTSITTVIKECAKAMGIGVGNLNKVAATEFPKGGGVFPTGTVLSGNAAEELRMLCKSVGWEYSIQNGALQILPRRKALEGTALLISDEPNTGLVGRPSVDNKGLITATVLMLPDLFPGRRVRFETDEVKGFYRVNECTYTGDTAGDDWNVEIVGEPLVPVK